jgi:hypothetical protein
VKDLLQIVSFPKSGRTWLRVMLDDVGATAGYTHDDSDHIRRRRLSDLNPDKTNYTDRQVLLLTRDPRDTAVSGYFQALHRLQLPVGPISVFLRDERHGIEKICHFNKQWFDAGPQVKCFAILSYEQMHIAPETALIAAANFAGVDLPFPIAEEVVSNRKFSRMQAGEASGEFARYGSALEPGNFHEPESFKVRRGVVGGYKDYLSDADISYCDRILAEMDYEARSTEALSQWSFEPLKHLT